MKINLYKQRQGQSSSTTHWVVPNASWPSFVGRKRFTGQLNLTEISEIQRDQIESECWTHSLYYLCLSELNGSLGRKKVLHALQCGGYSMGTSVG